MIVKVREAEYKDFPKINELYEQVDKIHRNAHPEEFRKQNKPGRAKEYLELLITNYESLLIVSEINDEVIGFSEAYITVINDFPMHKQRSLLLIDCIVVDEKRQKLGAGQKMLNYLTDYAKSMKLDGIELEVYSFNKGAESFYINNGFTEISKSLRRTIK